MPFVEIVRVKYVHVLRVVNRYFTCNMFRIELFTLLIDVSRSTIGITQLSFKVIAQGSGNTNYVSYINIKVYKSYVDHLKTYHKQKVIFVNYYNVRTTRT